MEPSPTNMRESSILDLFQTKSSSISFNSKSDSDPEPLPASPSEETALNHCDISGLSGGSISPHETSPGEPQPQIQLVSVPVQVSYQQ